MNTTAAAQPRIFPRARQRVEGAERALLAPVRGVQQLIGDFFLFAMRLATSARNGACNGIVDLLDVSAPGTCLIRTGSQETNVGDSDGGTLLGTLTFSSTAFGNSSTGVATAASITSDTNADASGTAGHFRAKDGAGAIVFDGTCGNGSGDMSFSPTNVIVAGGTIACSSFTVTVPIS